MTKDTSKKKRRIVIPRKEESIPFNDFSLHFIAFEMTKDIILKRRFVIPTKEES
jgi:hypothetical protein